MIRNEFYADPVRLSDPELERHIRQLQDKRETFDGLNPPSIHNAKTGALNYPMMGANEIAVLLMIAVAERNSRGAARQTKASIDLSREAKALAEASLEQAKQSTKLSRWAIIVASVGVVATVVNAVIAVAEIVT